MFGTGSPFPANIDDKRKEKNIRPICASNINLPRLGGARTNKPISVVEMRRGAADVLGVTQSAPGCRLSYRLTPLIK